MRGAPKEPPGKEREPGAEMNSLRGVSVHGLGERGGLKEPPDYLR